MRGHFAEMANVITERRIIRMTGAGASRIALLAAASGLTSGAGYCTAANAAEAQQQPNLADGIVVTGQRELRDAVPDVSPERSVDADGVAGYGASTIRDVLAEIAREEGDTEDPVLFVNGVPIEDIEDIIDFPAEALERVDVLPRGAGVRAGGRAGQRAYNVVLRKQYGSIIGTAGYGLATEGGWRSANSEALVTRIAGRRRFNLTLRVTDESLLRESRRGIVQPDTAFPFASAANIIADPTRGTDEIDPILSAAAGRRVTLVGVPATVTNPALADMVAGAFRPNATNLADFRSLRPASRAYEAAANYSQPLNSWLNITANLRAEQREFDGLAGLAAGLFILPSGHPQSPFGEPVAVARYLEVSPLQQDSRQRRANAALGMNGMRGKWQLGLRGDFRFYDYTSQTDRPLRFAGQGVALAADQNPFAEDIAGLLPIGLEIATSRVETYTLAASANGPLFDLPAGPVRLGLNGDFARRLQSGQTEGPFFQSSRKLQRSEISGKAALEIPITSRDNGFHGGLGDLSASLNFGLTEVPSLGTVDRHGFGLLWEPTRALRFQFTLDRERLLPDVGQLADAVTISENVRFFDFVTGETVDIIQISGGNRDLRNERGLRRRLSGELKPWAAIDLRVTAEHLLTRQSDPISSLPPASLDLLLAFPDRFVRDTSGRLISADIRPVNFVAERTEQLRWGISFGLPAKPVAPPAAQPPAPRRGPKPLRTLFDLSHVINLLNEVTVRDGAPVIDLLDGGATGYGGSLPRHQVIASFNMSNELGGLRIGTTWRGGSTLRQGAGGPDEVLDLEPFAMVNLRSHLELGAIWPQEKVLKSTRVSLNVTNILNQRQQIVDRNGDTPLRFQPGYRDPVGRSIQIELRRSF
ncbi:MAG: hypothetical protein U0995_07520 [Erythrobacter sp.]|nr:hypothetical protein [Erythrobacter sp.]